MHQPNCSHPATHEKKKEKKKQLTHPLQFFQDHFGDELDPLDPQSRLGASLGRLGYQLVDVDVQPIDRLDLVDAEVLQLGRDRRLVEHRCRRRRRGGRRTCCRRRRRTRSRR